MNKSFIAVVVILGLALVAAGVFCFTLTQDKNTLTIELNATRNELAATKAELAATTKTLASTQQTLTGKEAELKFTTDLLSAKYLELETTKDTLNSTKSALNSTNQTLTSKLAELSSAKEQIASAQVSLTTLQASMSKTQQQLTTAQETLRGLGITLSASSECYDVKLVDNINAKNPTFKELKAFLAGDRTENHAYVLNVYDCSQFSRDVHNNAEALGIRSAVVHITLENEAVGHAFNAFLTADYGLIYVDCTKAPDMIARVKTGKQFRGVDATWVFGTNIRNDSWWDTLGSYYYLSTSTGGQAVVESIKIYW